MRLGRRDGEAIAILKIVEASEHQQRHFQCPFARCGGSGVEHLAVAPQGDDYFAVRDGVHGHQAPPMTSRRRERPSITAADARISAARLANCSMRVAACLRSAAWWGWSLIHTLSAPAPSLAASPRISSRLTCSGATVPVLRLFVSLVNA